MIRIIKKDNTICEITVDNIEKTFLDLIKDNNHIPNNSIQTLYSSLNTQSQYCPNTSSMMSLYGVSNIKATLLEGTLVSIKRFYISVLLNLKLYLEMLGKIIYTKRLFIILPIYPKIILKNIFKQHYSSVY